MDVEKTNETVQINLVQTEDGSDTLYSPIVGETYHSVHGAINESLHVFFRSGFDLCNANSLSVLEVGFGTGLNAYLAISEAEKVSKKINYVSIERFPISEIIWKKLNYAQMLGDKVFSFNLLHESEWNKSIEITDKFSLKKIHDAFENVVLNDNVFDLVFYDAFSPEKQPELWTEPIFRKLYQAMKVGGILTTYCAKGVVRRAMQSAGFLVERIPGPIGKREMLRARKI